MQICDNVVLQISFFPLPLPLSVYAVPLNQAISQFRLANFDVSLGRYLNGTEGIETHTYRSLLQIKQKYCYALMTICTVKAVEIL